MVDCLWLQTVSCVTLSLTRKDDASVNDFWCNTAEQVASHTKIDFGLKRLTTTVLQKLKKCFFCRIDKCHAAMQQNATACRLCTYKAKEHSAGNSNTKGVPVPRNQRSDLIFVRRMVSHYYYILQKSIVCEPRVSMQLLNAHKWWKTLLNDHRHWDDPRFHPFTNFDTSQNGAYLWRPSPQFTPGVTNMVSAGTRSPARTKWFARGIFLKIALTWQYLHIDKCH